MTYVYPVAIVVGVALIIAGAVVAWGTPAALMAAGLLTLFWVAVVS